MDFARASNHTCGLSIRTDGRQTQHRYTDKVKHRVWEQALKEIPNWPGFKRLKLSEKDQEYYEQKIKQNDQFD
jgi:hypothetical protein